MQRNYTGKMKDANGKSKVFCYYHRDWVLPDRIYSCERGRCICINCKGKKTPPMAVD